jgi:hypothetical protein
MNGEVASLQLLSAGDNYLHSSKNHSVIGAKSLKNFFCFSATEYCQ